MPTLVGFGTFVALPEEHEAWFREGTEVIDFFAPPRKTSYSAANPPT
jgi:hypothetical protein